ncbi:MAG: chemotaxis protein CheB, partial [Acidobacteria bacterium]|nr:chemotaxis protein CheB [Acidobacteriota bacterium]
ATDYCTKPANVGSVTAAQERIRQHLAPKLRLLTERARQRGGRTVAARSVVTPAAPPRPVVITPPVRPASTSTVVGLPHVLAIGTSTGGPNALASLLPALPADLPVPVVIVQHMPPLFTKLLADRLHQQCPFPVHEATNGQIVEAGHVYLAPGDFHMETVRRGADIVIRLSQAPPENSCRPAVDVLFRSVVDVYGGHVLGVILTGMGQDGLVGSRHIVEAGGRVLAQDEASSVVWGMPGFVVHAGLASAVVPLAGMAKTMAGLLGPRHDAAINGKSHVALNH